MTRRVKNILFIMCDQLRADHLSCFGHPRLHTPNLDGLAARGVIFDRAYVNSPVCGPSRMSYYTGRYVHSHGASWNFVPLKAGEMTIGDHLRPLGVRSVLVGKTHMRADLAGMSRLGIDPKSQIGVRIGECGFDPYERDDGIHPYSGHDPDPSYSDYLRRNGFGGDNPWEAWANSTVDDDGTVRSGWFLKYSNRPARIPDEHSETPYITRRAIDFIAEAGDQPWCLHLSYIKPHWPYIVPEPYASLYQAEDALPVVRSEREREQPHPVYGAMMNHRVSRTFSKPGVRDAVMPGYMGLIKQIDDQMGVLFDHLQRNGLMDNTMIVFTSDHGDYLGDHWMGEKDLFHEPVIRAPLIVYDPDDRADATRGMRCSALVEAIDLAPTFLDVYGGTPAPHVFDGRSLRPLLFGSKPADWREHVVCEYDFAFQDSRIELAVKPRDAWLRMIFDGRWKYVLVENQRPMLFDLATDPNEFDDLGASTAPEHLAARARLHEALFKWARQPRQRVTIADGTIESVEIQPRITEGGILIGYWDEADLAEARKSFKARFASTNPLVKPTLDRLTNPEACTKDTKEQAMTKESPDITRANTSLDGVSWNILGQIYVPKQISDDSFSWHATFPVETFVPPHVHPHQDEYIFVLDGRIDLLLGGKKTSASTGDLVRMPRGIPHAFFNNSGEAVTTLFWAAPAGKLVELYQRIHNLSSPAEVVQVARDYDVVFFPPVSSAA